jgi:hypothetical protein
MKLVAVLTATILGAAITPAWCPEPAKSTVGIVYGATGDAYSRPKPPPLTPQQMTPSMRANILHKEVAAGRVTTKEEKSNFVRTGNPKTPPPTTTPKVTTKPAHMTQARWDQIQRMRSPQSGNSAMDRLSGQ